MHSVKTHRTAKHRVAPNINYGIQLMTMYKNHLISCSKCTTLIQDISNMKDCGGGWGWEFCVSRYRMISQSCGGDFPRGPAPAESLRRLCLPTNLAV